MAKSLEIWSIAVRRTSFGEFASFQLTCALLSMNFELAEDVFTQLIMDVHEISAGFAKSLKFASTKGK